MARKVLEKAREVLAGVEFKHDPLDQALRAAAQELGVKAGQMFQPVQWPWTLEQECRVFETLEVVGKESTLARIDQAVRKIA